MSQATSVGFRAPPKGVVYFFLALGLVLVGVALFIPVPRPTIPLVNDVEVIPPKFDPVPVFQLTERSGQIITNKDLDGKVWIAAFQFSRCRFCPSVAATMARLQSELNLANRDDIRLVTFTVDPEHDTPDELKKYAERFNAHPSKWLFLTGSETYIRLLLERGFHVAAKQNNDAPVDMKFDHDLRLVLVDQMGRIVDFFDGMVGTIPEDATVPNREEEQARLQTKFNDSYADLKARIAELTGTNTTPSTTARQPE
jgi:protein SCO1/2